MQKKPNISDEPAGLRRRAEARLSDRQTKTAPPRTDADTKRQLHELEVHQIELEMQNAELQAARDQLETALEKYTDLYDFAPVGYLTLDHEGDIREANLAGASLLRIARSALVNRRFGLFVSPADGPAYGAFLKQVFESRAREECEVRLLVGGKHSVDVRMRAIIFESGQACRVALTDITERKRAEAALHESEARKGAILESALDGIITIDQTGRITEFNPSAEKIFGYQRAEVLGKEMAELIIPPALRDRHRRGLAHYLATGEATVLGQRIELTALRRDGAEFPVELSITQFPNQRPPMFTGFVRDITEHKRAEGQIAASLKEKEALLKEIHHRVKNNLQVISSLLSLQSNFIQDPQAREMFRESQDRVKLMALIHEKLYQSRDLARIEFREYIRDLLSMVFHAYRSKSEAITLDIQIEPIFLEVHDAVPVSLILNEMVSNCLKHAFPDGHNGVITIYFKKHPQGQFSLVVRDNGIGVPKDFDLENSASLGLRLIRILARQIGGALDFCSQGGTEFKVTFGKQSNNERSET